MNGQQESFAGLPYEHQPQGGSCTCSVTLKDGRPMVIDSSRCPLHWNLRPTRAAREEDGR